MVVKLVEIFGLNVGILIIGVLVDIVVFDLVIVVLIDVEVFELMVVNILFIGWIVKGKIFMIFVDGVLVWLEEV